MKATLLIKNIENCYTCDSLFRVLKHAFIAIHHDKIIDIGTGSYMKWIEPTTRVIDAVGETVIPAMIDCHYQGFRNVRLGDQLRENNAALYAMSQNGILTLLTYDPKVQRKELTQDVFLIKKKSTYPLIETETDYLKHKPEHFLLSCGFGSLNRYVYSLQPICHYLFTMMQVSSKTLLEGMTSLPAKDFNLNDRGSLEIGKCADILILQVPTIEHYFQTIGRPLIHRMIKNGIQFYPQWMVC